MKSWSWVLVLATLAVGCGERAQPAAPAPPAQVPAPPQDDALMRGRTNLFLYDAGQAGGGSDKPRFEVRDVEVVLDENGAWSFVNPHAIIYGRDGTETHLQAGQGYLDERNGRAVLSGGVKMEMGARSVELQDIEWSRDDGVAKSDNPVTLRDGDTVIQANRMRYDPDTKSVIMEDFTAQLAYHEE